MYSSVLNIPVDIIQEIFGHLASPILHTRPGCPFPWVLGHICSEWRAIFLSMKPQFWSHIAIRYEELEFDPQKVRRIKEMLEFFLNRNRGDAFSFDYIVLAFTVPSDAKAEDMHPVLDLLVEESIRWENVSIMVVPQDLPILRRIRNRLPFLRKLIVATHEHGLPTASNDMFEHAPLLRDVTLSDPSWKLNWSALTTVALHTSLNDMLGILSQMSNVEILSLLSHQDGISGPGGLITLPRLSTLIVERKIPHILDLLKAPGLENLTLLCDIEGSRVIITPSGLTQSLGNSPLLITSFLSRSSCSIRYLSLGLIDGESLASILRCTPNITSLKFTLHYKWRGSRCLACLSLPENFDDENPSRGLLACHLKSLIIEAFPYGGYTDQPFLQEEISMLIRIVKSRTIIFDKNEDIIGERLQNLIVDMPRNEALPYELTELVSLCAEVGVVFQYSLDGVVYTSGLYP